MTTSITDDVSMDAALYGSAHIPTILTRDDAAKIIGILDDRATEALSRVDMDIAHELVHYHSYLIYSDEVPDSSDLPQEYIDTLLALRDFVRFFLSSRLVRSWDRSIDERGKLIGLGEHSARRASSGQSEKDYKIAVLRQIGGGR